MEKKKFKINIHLVFALLVIAILIYVVVKILGFGQHISKEEIDAITVPDNAEIQVFDYMFPVMIDDDGTFPADDQKTTVVCFGNAPFSDDYGQKNNVCNMFAEKTGATVYNVSVDSSYLSTAAEECLSSYIPLDAYSLYWMVNAMLSKDLTHFENAATAWGTVPADTQKAVDTMMKIDFNTVDAVFIMYDGNDYLSNRKVYNDESPDAYDYVNGSISASVKLLQENFPWLRIIVVSPTFAYVVQEDGSYVSSDRVANGWGVKLSDYVIKEAEITYDLAVSYVDMMYGGIHEENADEYLQDNIHLNQKGRELVVERMIEALERYTTIYK